MLGQLLAEQQRTNKLLEQRGTARVIASGLFIAMFVFGLLTVALAVGMMALGSGSGL
ncbi:MAG: hypothetical protein AAGB51_06295 [Planctomycetota bacterium]